MNDRFTMRCPKCLSTGLERLPERVTNWGGLDIFALKCRNCGKVLYGDKVCQEEYDSQYDVWRKDAPTRRKAAEEAGRKRAAEAEITRRAAQAERDRRARKRREQEEERQRKERDNRAWVELNRRKQVERVVEPVPEVRICAWKDCDEPARSTSLYCSRNCSNKNARWRHKVRQQSDTVAA